MGPIEAQIIAIVTLFLVGILTIKDSRVRDILTVVPVGIIMILLLKDLSPSSSSSNLNGYSFHQEDPLTLAMTEYFQSQTRNQVHHQQQYPQQHQHQQQHEPQVNRHPILGPIQDLQSDPLFSSIASHINTRVFLIKSPSNESNSSGLVAYNSNSRQAGGGFLESFESSSSSVGAGMGLSTFFQNSYTTTPGTMWGATNDLQGGRIVLQEHPKQMLHDPKLTSLITTMIVRHPERKNDLLEVSRRYHHEVLGTI
jgi:hypothetical protein